MGLAGLFAQTEIWQSLLQVSAKAGLREQPDQDHNLERSSLWLEGLWLNICLFVIISIAPKIPLPLNKIPRILKKCLAYIWLFSLL